MHRFTRFLKNVACVAMLLGGAAANAQNILTEGFESGNVPPTGWTSTSQGSYVWSAGQAGAGYAGGLTITPHTGSWMAYFHNWLANNYSANLITKAIPLQNYTGGYGKVSFYFYRMNNYSASDNVQVYVNTTPDLNGSPTLLGQVYVHYTTSGLNSPAVSTAGWYPYSYNIPASYNNANAYIIFKDNSNYEYDSYMDDISIDYIAPCVTPTAQATNIQFNVVPGIVGGTVVPATTGGGDSYLIVRTNGTTPVGATPVNGTPYSVGSTLGNGTVVSAGTSLTFNDPGLQPSTLYTYTVFTYNSVCSGNPPLYLTSAPLVRSVTTAYSGITPVLLSGYNADEIANGTLPVALTVTSSPALDASNNYFVSQDYSYNSNAPAAGAGLPTSRVITSASTPGLTWQLANYTGNNDLIFLPGGNGTLTLNTPQASGLLYVLVSVGNGGSSGAAITAQVNFSDGTNQQISFTAYDWASANSNPTAISGLALIGTNNAVSAGNRYMNQVALAISPANANKPITSIKFTNTNSTGYTSIWAISLLTPCTMPAGQPSNFAYTTTVNAINGSFSPTPTASAYFVVRTPANTPFTGAGLLQNGTTYTVGSTIGNGMVVYSGAGTSFSDNSVLSSTTYTYTVFAVNNTVCTGGPVYNTASPLVAQATSAFNGYTPVPVNGFNYDWVANGTGPAAGSISPGNGFDGSTTQKNAYVAADYIYNTNVVTSGGLPLSRIVNSNVTSGLKWQLADYSGPNCLWLPKVSGSAPNSTGTLTLVNPQATNNVYVLASTGSGSSTVSAVVNFIDGTSQPFTFNSTDWGTSDPANAVTALAAVNSVTNAVTTGTQTHVLNQYILNISSANANKPIASITFTNTGNGGYVGIWGISTLAACQPLNVQASNLNLTSGQSSISGSFTASTPAANGYVVIRTTGFAAPSIPPANYTFYTPGTALGNGVVVAAGTGTSFTDVNLAASTTYTYWVYSYTTSTICASPIYNTLNPLTRSAATNPANTYTWNQTVSGSFTTASNWTPARNNPDPADILVFNNGNDTVTNIPSQTIARISVNNNTTVRLRAGATTSTLTINSDGIATTNEVDIATGSSIISDGTTSALTIAFNNNVNGPANVNIAGTLEVSNTSASIANILNFANSIDTVRATGTLAAGGINVTAAIAGMINTSSAIPTNNISIQGTYNHKYTTIGGPLIPTANWLTGSTLLFSGYTSATTPPSLGMGQAFYNVIYNCPQQSVNMNWAGTPFTSTGTFTMASTGTGALQLAGNNAYTDNFNNYVQTGGTLDLSSASSVLTQVLNVSGNFNQTGGLFMATNPNVTPSVTVNFNGSALQQVNFSTSPSGPITYRVSNFFGINTTSTPPLSAAPIWVMNSGGGIRISTSSASPITSNTFNGNPGGLAITYTTGTTLTYDTLANINATTNVWPSVAPPYNVNINVGTGNAVSVPFSATIAGTLTFISGDINMSSNTLTIGTSAVNAGAIVPSNNINSPGSIRLTSGSLKRWFNPSLVPTTPSAVGSLGYFPIALGLSQRYVYVYFSNTSALATGGTIAVSHNGYNTTGLQTVNVADASPTFTITSQTKASWTLTNTGITLAGGTSMGLKITGADMFNPLNVANLRLMHASSVAGNYVPGSGLIPNVSAERNNLQLSDLATPFYIGGDGTSIQPIFTAITTGNWTDGTKWDQGAAPGPNNIAVINPGVTTTINATSCAAKTLTVNGTLTATAGNTLTIDSTILNNGVINMTAGSVLVSTSNTVLSSIPQFYGITNNGAFTVNGGNVQVGPNGGSNKQFVNNAALTVQSGNLTINGNLNNIGSSANPSANSSFIQRGGTIFIDGNAGGNPAKSVNAGTALLNFGSSVLTLTGGTLTIVDPHADASSNTPTFQYAGALPFTDSNAHTIAFGDGSSVDTGGSSKGFLIEANGNGRFNFGTLVVNGGIGTNRRVTPVHPFGVNGNMIINNGGEYYTNGVPLYVNGNLIVNTGGTLTNNNTINFSNYSTVTGTPVPSVNTQVFTSTGLLRNAPVVTPTASTASISIMNNAPVNPGVSVNVSGNLVFSGNLSFTPTNNIPTHLYMAPGFSVVETSSATVSNYGPANGWVVGTYQKHANVGALSQFYPIGDSLNFSPVLITGGSNAVVNPGDISVKVKPTIDPNFATSNLNPLAAVKRYFTLDTLNGIRFTPGAVSAVFSWVPSDVIGILTGVHVGFDSTANSSGGWVYPFLPLGSSSATSVQVTGLGDIGKFEGDYQPADTCPSTKITVQPVNTSACINGAAVFSVAATGAGLTYEWHNTAYPSIIYGTAPVLNISPVQANNAGNYYVVVRSICAKPDTSNTASLVIGGSPVVTAQPLSQTICLGAQDTIRFIVNTNTLGTQYTWYHNYSNLPITAGPHAGSGTTYLLTSPSTSFRSDTLMIVHPTGNDSGVYSVVMSIGCAADTSYPATLTINMPPVANIVAQGPTSFCTGGSVQINATTGAGYSYQWLNANTPVGAQGSTYSATASGVYSVEVTNANGCVDTSNQITVDANSLPAPGIASTSSNSFCTGDTITLTTQAIPGQIYEWQQNGVTVAGPSTTLTSYGVTQGGVYDVRVSTPNGCMGVSAPITIHEVAAPAVSIIAGGSTNICSGASVNLNASSGPGFTYQWQNNSMDIAGQTGSTFSANSAGTYDVVISNGACSVTSNSIPVTVMSSPSVTITPAGSTTFCHGSSLTLQATSGNGWSYQWNRDGISIPSATDSVFIATDAGNYTVMATNSNNCTTTSVAVPLIVNPLPMPVVSFNGTNQLSTVSIYNSYQWYLDSHPIPGATNSTYTALQDGTYSVFVTDVNGCGNMSSGTLLGGLSVSSFGNSGDVRIYPNPAASIVHIDAPYKVNVTVSSLDGKVVLDKQNVTEINISSLANGVYMIKVANANGDVLTIEKLIKTDNN